MILWMLAEKILPAGQGEWKAFGPAFRQARLRGIKVEGVLEGCSEKGSFGKDLQKGEKHLPWKGHNSGKPLLVNG
jgi:hypothetical protein